MKLITAIIITLLSLFTFGVNELVAQTIPVESGTDANLEDDSGYLRLGNTNGLNVVYDENEIQARLNGSTSSLFLNNEGGNVHIKDFLRIGSGQPVFQTKFIEATATFPVIGIAHGLTASKILGIDVISFEPSGGTAGNVYRHKNILSITASTIFIEDAIPTGASYTVWITHRQ